MDHWEKEPGKSWEECQLKIWQTVSPIWPLILASILQPSVFGLNGRGQILEK